VKGGVKDHVIKDLDNDLEEYRKQGDQSKAAAGDAPVAQ
jgi:hypothetical protein